MTNHLFTTTVDEINFPLAPQLVDVEKKLELNSNSSDAPEIQAFLLKPNSQWEYKEVEGVRLIHYYNKIYDYEYWIGSIITYVIQEETD